MTTRYTGMNPDGTGNLNDMEHLKQSVRDILTTPLASRVMRREYGSLVPDLIDEPMNNTTRLQCMSAAVIALTRWEPRIALDAIDVVWKAGGRAGVVKNVVRSPGWLAIRAFIAPICNQSANASAVNALP